MKRSQHNVFVRRAALRRANMRVVLFEGENDHSNPSPLELHA